MSRRIRNKRKKEENIREEQKWWKILKEKRKKRQGAVCSVFCTVSFFTVEKLKDSLVSMVHESLEMPAFFHAPLNILQMELCLFFLKH